MLNSYVNNGKKKLVATTLALAITFSSVSSVSYKLCDSLCLNASAAELEQTQANDAEIEAKLDAISNEKSALVDFQESLTKEVLPILNQLDSEARELKEELKDDKDKLKKRVKAAYDVKAEYDSEESYKKCRDGLIENAIINFFQYGRTLRPVDTCYCRTKCAVHDDLSSAIEEKITDCETFEEADNLIETIVNDEAYEKIDNLVLQYYVNKGPICVNGEEVYLEVLLSWLSDEDVRTDLSALDFLDLSFTESSVNLTKSAVNNILDQIAARLNELEKEEVEIRQNTELMDEVKKNKDKRKKVLEEEYKALKEQSKTLEKRREVLNQQRKELDLKYSVLRDEISTVGDKMKAIKTELAELDQN